MTDLSENYRLRQCYLQTDTVPSMSMIKKKMSNKLAAIYFKSMTPKLKVVAGLEPSLKGGGENWYVPPQDILEGRPVLKPTSKEMLSKLNYKGIDTYGLQLYNKHRRDWDLEKEQAVLENDIERRNLVMVISEEEAQGNAVEAKKKNKEYMMSAFNYFAYLYRQSLDKIDTLFKEAAVAEIKRSREKSIRYMQKHYAESLKTQSITLYKLYTKKLEDEKTRLKNEFINDLEVKRTKMGDTLHDLNVDKYLAIENLRKFLDCRNLACQVYVALKEREEYEKEMQASKYKHKKQVKELSEKIALKDLEVYVASKKDRRRQELTSIWQKKICHVIKKFQIFVSYCLSTLPEQAEFFINMEKLMMIQLSKVLEQPSAESIIEIEEEQFHTPIPKPNPFHLFCDKGYKPRLDEKLCPKRGASNTSQFPVIVINKRCLYAACDNLEEYTTKIRNYFYGDRGDDTDFEDNINYAHCVPVKYRSSRQLLDLKLESSLLQVLHQEIPNITDVPLKTDFYDTSCLCTPCDTTRNASNKAIQETISFKDSPKKMIPASKRVELMHEREPKWESYFDYVEPKKCMCTRRDKKHLSAHLPAYMKQTSKYEPPELMKYKMCSVTTLKKLVNQARKQSLPSIVSVPSTTRRDASTQYEDVKFAELCTCFSDIELRQLLSCSTMDPAGLVSSLTSDTEFKIVGSPTTSAPLGKKQSSFVTKRIRSLRNIVEDLPDLTEIFARKDCLFK